jgi:hypothetical protein
LSVSKLELGVVLNLVEENNATVWHKTSVHGGDTGAAENGNSSRLCGDRSRARAGSRHDRAIEARTRLASLSTVGSGITTEPIHGAARARCPVSANHVLVRGAAATISGGFSCSLGSVGRKCRGVAEDRFA